MTTDITDEQRSRSKLVAVSGTYGHSEVITPQVDGTTEAHKPDGEHVRDRLRSHRRRRVVKHLEGAEVNFSATIEPSSLEGSDFDTDRSTVDATTGALD